MNHSAKSNRNESVGLQSAAALARATARRYGDGQTDYWMEPLVLVGADGRPIGRVGGGDAVIFCCRRGEREIQLTDAFVAPEFPHFPRCILPDLRFVLLTLYHEKYAALPVAFRPAAIPDTLGELVSRAGRRQLRAAESEKFAHVTFFFNGGRHEPFPGEDRIRVPSPRGVPVHTVPELSLPEVAARTMAGIGQGYDLIVVNFANGDVIGHTADTAAKVRCAEAVDRHLGARLAAAGSARYLSVVTADHGNLEELITADGSPHVAHTSNPVPFLVVDPGPPGPRMSPRPGRLADVAPTILDAMGLPRAEAMTGASLLPPRACGTGRRVLLAILDGWGIGAQDDGNPIHLARTPVWDTLSATCPRTTLDAAGEAVGLQPGNPGNSEAGHLNLGAGRVVLQDEVRLDQAMRDGSFLANPVFRRTLEEVRERRSALHLLALLSEQSSHGTIAYPLALLELAKRIGLAGVYIHLIFDGRSTPPGSAPRLLQELGIRMAEIGLGEVVTAVGRGLALDRDGNFARTRQAYDALVHGIGYPCPAT
jgi:2,3-bisphosphoglycerate-independent phosphoglycerate mutase